MLDSLFIQLKFKIFFFITKTHVEVLIENSTHNIFFHTIIKKNGGFTMHIKLAIYNTALFSSFSIKQLCGTH